MIKITCTKSEQEAIINIIARNECDCLFDDVEPTIKINFCQGALPLCFDCLRKNIEWEVIDG